MSEIDKPASDFIGYEYIDVLATSQLASMYIDCYRNFGWEVDGNVPLMHSGGDTKIKLKRDRKIMNKTELTRLQRHFEACAKEMAELERAKTSRGRIGAITAGVLGTVFMAGATFAVTNEPPIVWLCVLLAIPGLAGWILPYFLYQILVRDQTGRITPLMEQKYEELYEVCEKGSRLTGGNN